MKISLAMTIAAPAMSPTPTIAQTTEAIEAYAKIPLGNVNGRIDHMAVDLARQRLSWPS
jgi:hypothetical protein